MRADQKSLSPPRDYRLQFNPRSRKEAQGGGENEMRGKVDNAALISLSKMSM